MKYIILLIAAAAIISYVVKVIIYRKSDYYQGTHNSYIKVISDKGYYGEYLLAQYLKGYISKGAKFLYNCYLPKDNGETTEVDVMMIYQSGIYVFESKNYSGWIFGSEYAKTWTQTLPSGRRSHKEHFLNPIMQNKLHIKWLQEQIGDKLPVHSIIVFSERCTLKQINLISGEVNVIRRNMVSSTVRDIDAKTGCELTQQQVDDIYSKLVPFTMASEEVKRRHIERIKKSITENEDMIDKSEIPEDPEKAVAEKDSLICPKCGGKLVLKTAIRGTYAGGQFYGCSNYPKCKYIKKI